MTEYNEAGPVTTDKKGKRQKAEPTLIGDLETGTNILENLLRTDFHDIASVEIRTLCTNKEIKQGGRVRPGKVSKATPIQKYAFRQNDVEPEVIIMVSLPVWNEADLHKRTAIIAHLLSWIQAEENEEDGELKIKIVSPQVSEFPEIVEKYGAWSPELEDFRQAITSTPATVAPSVRQAVKAEPETA